MEIIAKLYSNQFATVPYTQVSEILNASIEEKITTFGTATISIPKTTQGIKKYQFIELCSIESSDVILFRGFIQDYLPDNTQITLTCKSEKAILQYKKVVANATFTSQSISSILTSILTAWNSAYGDTFSVSTSSVYTLGKKDVKYGDTIYDIIEELATSAQCVWDCQNGVIRIEPLLGNDYTIEGNIKEVIFDPEDPHMSNASDFAPTSGVLASIVFGTDGTNTNTKFDLDAIADFGAIAVTEQFRKTDAAGVEAQTQQYLDSKKHSNFAYQLQIDQTKIELECGDKVLLTIQNTGSYTDFIGTALVNEKVSTLVNGSFSIKYTVAEEYFVRDDFYNRIGKIQSNLALNTIK